ncbi:MAG: NAD(+) synthase [Planctomycetota bacterium]
MNFSVAGSTGSAAFPPLGFLRVATVSPRVHVADPAKNASEIIKHIEQIDADLIVFPELAITAYTCGDLFARADLLAESHQALLKIAGASTSTVIVGLPWPVAGALMNVAAVLHGGAVVGIVPKSYLPNYREFYEDRHFRPASQNDPQHVRCDGREIPFGKDLLFRLGQATIGVEICEDFWTPIPPSSLAAAAGANVLVNLSASNETVGKPDWRRDLVRSQSGRCLAAYLYTSAGPGESTSDLVFGGHQMIAENGRLLSETRALGDTDSIHLDGDRIAADIDLDCLDHERRVQGSFRDASKSSGTYRIVDLKTSDRPRYSDLLRQVDATPFVPKRAELLDDRCKEIFALQSAGLIKRLSVLPKDLPLTIGISGGLDSTLALLVAINACDTLEMPRERILGLTLPGFGTTRRTRDNADELAGRLGIGYETTDIRPLCLDTFRAIGHRPFDLDLPDGDVADAKVVEAFQQKLQRLPDDAKDLTFENVQARIRTMLLMSRGFVLGTGDMSEQALGWSTYNADHMSMYNVNTSVPKTLVRFLIRHVADHHNDGELGRVLHAIADTPISPELLPPDADGKIRQETQASIGAYELHDFFLYHFIRHGAGREKILALAEHADFESTTDSIEIGRVFDRFQSRFYANQFKRNCVPDGPKVGSVSLSPRGDWRMPADLDRG